MYSAVCKVLGNLIVLLGLFTTFVVLFEALVPKLSQDRSVFVGYVQDFEDLLPARHLPHYYQVLDINFNATKAEMRRAYKMKSRTMHPDKNQRLNKEQTGKNQYSRTSALKQKREKDQHAEQYLQLQDAYATLSNPVLRCRYDCNEFRKYGLTKRAEHWEIICKSMFV